MPSTSLTSPAAHLQRLREQGRQNRMEHFRRNITKQTGEGQNKSVV
jgi:hypothetical protein